MVVGGLALVAIVVAAVWIRAERSGPLGLDRTRRDHRRW
jgi:FtsZ-interacting cell division protein ZipA